jgi:hypothetical protein
MLSTSGAAGLAMAMLVALAGLFVLAPSAQAVGTVDQQQLLNNGTCHLGSSGKAQTFTAGRSGRLDRVDVSLTSLGSVGTVTVELRTTVAGAPSNTVLGSDTISAAGLGGLTTTHPTGIFTSIPQVQVGTVYAIVVYATLTAGDVEIGCDTTQSYAGGQGYLGSPASPPTSFTQTVVDYTFRTFV